MPPDVGADVPAAAAETATTKRGGSLEGSEVAHRVALRDIEGGRYGRTLHVGPYEDEPRSFEQIDALIDALIDAEGLTPALGHLEVYLSDARRTPPEKLKTVLLRRIE